MFVFSLTRLQNRNVRLQTPKMSQEEFNVFVVAFQSLSNCSTLPKIAGKYESVLKAKSLRGFLRGMASVKEEGLMSVSMIYNTQREWVFVRVPPKIITGSVGYNKPQ